MKTLISLFIVSLFTVGAMAEVSTVQTKVDSFRVTLTKTDDTPTVLVNKTMKLSDFDREITQCDRSVANCQERIENMNADIAKLEADKAYWEAQKVEAEKTIIEVPDFNTMP